MPTLHCPVGGGDFTVGDGKPKNCPCHGFDGSEKGPKTPAKKKATPLEDLARGADRIKVSRDGRHIGAINQPGADLAEVLAERFGPGKVTLNATKNGQKVGELVIDIPAPASKVEAQGDA